MQSKSIIFLLFILSITIPVKAQLDAGQYQAFPFTDKNKIEDDPELMPVNVVELGYAFCWFTDAATRKPLNGNYRIIINNRRYADAGFTKGLINGKWEEYYYNKPAETATFDAGRLNGKYTEYYADGKTINLEVVYKKVAHGSIMQSYTAWHENGELKETRSYDENGKQHGKSTKYNEDGRIVSGSEFIHGRQEGRSMHTGSDGSTTQTEYKNGVKLSESQFYPNGKPKLKKVHDEESRRVGIWIEAEENGDLISETPYKDDEKDGIEKIFYKNNVLRSETAYKEGKKNGKEIIYEESPHKVQHEGTFLDDKRHGVFKVYHNGVLWKETYYQDDKVVSEKQYEDGKLQLLNMLDETGTLVNVEKYDRQGKPTYKNTSYRKHPSLRLKEDASGIIDIDVE